jgi:hypothetical protein
MANLDIDWSPLESIPPPDLIRSRLARLFAEARLLRSLLRLSESKSRCLSSLRGTADCHGKSTQEEVSLAK